MEDWQVGNTDEPVLVGLEEDTQSHECLKDGCTSRKSSKLINGLRLANFDTFDGTVVTILFQLPTHAVLVLGNEV